MDYEMCDVKIESIQLVKDLSVTVLSNLKSSQQCSEVAKKANRILGLIKRKNSRVYSYSRIMMLQYAYSFVRPH